MLISIESYGMGAWFDGTNFGNPITEFVVEQMELTQLDFKFN